MLERNATAVMKRRAHGDLLDGWARDLALAGWLAGWLGEHPVLKSLA